MTEGLCPTTPPWRGGTVGGVAVANPFWLAPLAGISLPAVRAFFRELGVGLVHTEMVSCAGLAHGNRKTREMLPVPGEHPVVLQLFSAEPETMAAGAGLALGWGERPDAVQINMACPVRKVVRRGEGAALLKDPERAFAMVRALREAVPVPVWVKLRLTGDNAPCSTLAFCEGLIANGASHLTVHGRTASQHYSGISDRRAVCRIARALPGMVSGSGDIFTEADAFAHLREGCVAVLLARGVVRDLFLARRLALRLTGAPVRHPAVEERAALLQRLYRRLEGEKGERVAIILMKRFLGGMFKGLPGAVHLRRRIGPMRSRDDLHELLLQWTEYVHEGSGLDGCPGREQQ
ncbi:MAG: tRNA-dihydrouridine synthase family protein [Synergistales bacterium]|nr:tRNA-dihydrouridine synthase family protein [Synergistales bacterium]